MLRRVCPGRVNQVWLPGSLSQILTEAAKTNTEGNGLAEIMGSGCREGTGVRTNSPKQKMGNGLLAEAKESHRTPRWSLVIECPPVLPPGHRLAPCPSGSRSQTQPQLWGLGVGLCSMGSLPD